MTDDLASQPSARKRKKPRKSRKPLSTRLARGRFLSRAIAGTLRIAMAAVARLGRERALRIALRLVRTLGRMTPEHRMARASIAAAFPEKSQAEREAILTGAWENFARVAVEFVFLEDLAAGFDPAHPSEGAITISGTDQFDALRGDGKPAVIIAAHLANWEILGVVSHRFGLKTVLPFRGPANFHFAGGIVDKVDVTLA